MIPLREVSILLVYRDPEYTELNDMRVFSNYEKARDEAVLLEMGCWFCKIERRGINYGHE